MKYILQANSVPEHPSTLKAQILVVAIYFGESVGRSLNLAGNEKNTNNLVVIQFGSRYKILPRIFLIIV